MRTQQMFITKLIPLLTLFVQHTVEHLTTSVTNHSSSDIIQLLVMLPLDNIPYSHVSRWDRGLEILPGAQVAIEDINNDSSILPGHTLELVKVSIDTCNADQINVNALLPFAKGIPSPNLLGMIGLFCPPLLRILSPLAAREEISLFQLSGTSSPHAREHPNLNFIVPSTIAYYEAVFRMVKRVGWTRMFILSERFFDTGDLRNSTSLLSGLDITFREISLPLSGVVNELRSSRKNIVYMPVADANLTANMLCVAYAQSLVWPDYVWILQEHPLDDLLAYVTDDCSNQTILGALENAFLIRFQYHPDDIQADIVSGRQYGDYFQKYEEKLKEVSHGDRDLRPNLFANVLHDSIWAYALALNLSLDYLQINGSVDSVIEYTNKFEKANITEVVRRNLRTLNFVGASGKVHFNKNSDVEAFINIFQIGQNASLSRVGFYNQLSSSFSLNDTVVSRLPVDMLSFKYNLIDTPTVATLSTIVGLCIVLTTVVLVLFFYCRGRSKEIKATSPNLSVLMLVGCYLLFGAVFVHSLTGAFAIQGPGRVIFCGAVISGNTLGVNLIFVTLLLRMLRVYRIFSYFGKTGKLWSDKVLLTLVFVIIGGDIILILVWSFVDTFETEDVATYIQDSNPPYYDVVQFCSSEHLIVWLGLVLLKIGILFAVVVFLAIKTRKIQKENFKDTKKVNIYIFLTVMIISTIIPLWILLKSTGNAIGTYVVIYLAFGSTGLLCLVFLFIPKLTAPLLRSVGLAIQYDDELQTYTVTKIQKNTTVASGLRNVISPVTFSVPSASPLMAYVKEKDRDLVDSEKSV